MELSGPSMPPSQSVILPEHPVENAVRLNERGTPPLNSATVRKDVLAEDGPGAQEVQMEVTKTGDIGGVGDAEAGPANTQMEMDVDGTLGDRARDVSIKHSPIDDTALPDGFSLGQSAWEIKATAHLDSTSLSERPLNVGDALSYLDSVKKQFSDSPGVYNRFLDIMKDFKNQTIDTPGVIQRVSSLFSGYPSLIEGFNTFLPAGYRIECTVDAHDTNIITVTTPDGTIIQSQSADPTGPIAGPSAVTSLLEDSLPYTHEEMNPAMEYVTKIKQRFAGHADLYQEFIDILGLYKRSPVDQDQLATRIAKLFRDAPDLLSGLQHFMPRDMLGALDGTVPTEKEGRGSKHGKKRAADAGPASVGTSIAQKRKRKVPDREKEKEKEREKDRESEMPVKAVQSKTKKQKHQQSGVLDSLHPDDAAHSPPNSSYAHAVPPTLTRPGPSSYNIAPPASAHFLPRDDMFFFDRVRHTIDNLDVYNEFLKLINLFTQEIIDMRKLVEQSRTYLSDELFVQFKEILGWDASWESSSGVFGPSNGANGANVYNEGMERLTKENLSVRSGPSYRRLPASEANVPCSGRDEMCKSVLNDEWVSHPTWASEDSGFVAHKKNAYEEALHRSEEERHEYDFHIEAITRTIATLEPYHMKFMQFSPEERATTKQKFPLSGANKAIHQRIIKKVYGREAGLEVIQAIHDSPAIAIPIVFARLKQKEEEWKKAQREWNKVWRVIDARNYQKSLDHQGINFKANDKKAITSKTFMNQIESAREEQMAKRASLIDPLFARTRPRYQMAFIMDDVNVIEDVFKLTFSLLDRMQHHIGIADRRRVEGFLRYFVPMFFMIDPASFHAAFQARNATFDSEYFMADDYANFIDEIDEAASAGSSSRSGRTGRRGGGSDLRKKILKNNVLDKSAARKAKGNANSKSDSRLASPALASVTMAGDAPPSSETKVNGGMATQVTEGATSTDNPGRPVRRGSFFTNASLYSLLRLFEVLYSRLSTCKALAAKLASDPSSPYLANPVSSDLALLDKEAPDRRLGELLQRPSPAAHFYEYLLESCERLFDNQIDQQTFEEMTRYMFGTKAYIMFTVDKVIGAIIKQVQNILSDSKSLVLLEGLKRERETLSPTSIDLDEIRSNAEKAIGPDENLFRIDWAPGSCTMTIQLLGKDDASFDDYDVYTGRWQAYIDSFVSDEITRGLTGADVKPPFLSRNYRAVKKNPPSSAFVSRSGLEIKVCVRTYRMFFVSQTEDFLWREWSPQELKEVTKRSKARVARSRLWLERFSKEGFVPR